MFSFFKNVNQLCITVSNNADFDGPFLEVNIKNSFSISSFPARTPRFGVLVLDVAGLFMAPKILSLRHDSD